MKNFLFLLILLGLTACDDDQQDAAFIGSQIDISVVSEDGIDLLNPDNPNSFDEEQIRLYHLIDGEFEEANFLNSDYPKGYVIYQHAVNYRIAISGEVFQNNDMMTSLIKWNSSDTDTLDYKIERRANGATIIITKVWFNGNEVWDESTNTDLYFEIEK